MPIRAANEDNEHTPPGNLHIPHLHTATNTNEQNNNTDAPPNPSTPTTNTPTQNINDGYTPPPLPTLLPTDIRVLSQNINTLPTSTPAELEATLAIYKKHNPTIIGLQETNKNWSVYEATIGRLRSSTSRIWPGSKIVTAHCKDDSFTTTYQPGGVAQMVLRQLTGRIVNHGSDTLG